MSPRSNHHVPVLDIGGTHVTGALFDPSTGALVPGSRHRRELDSSADRADILDRLLSCASRLDARTAAVWGVAVPGPFEYDTGVARYHDVGKFEALNGVDIGRVLREGVGSSPASIRFLNDASAFGLGECTTDGAAVGHERVIGLTLGTGVGSVFLQRGVVLEDRVDVPPQGRVDLLRIDGRPLEDVVSRRAIVARYAELRDTTAVDVDVIAERAADGDSTARHVFTEAFRMLGTALRPWVRSFAADLLVLGGSISASWSLVAAPVREAIGDVPVVRARLGGDAALVGVGSLVSGSSGAPGSPDRA